MSEPIHSESWLPLSYGGGVRVVGEEGDRALEVVVSICGESIIAGRVPLASVIRHLLPEAGFVVCRDWRGTTLTLDTDKGPVCVGGPYDGKRLLKSAGGMFAEIRVPVSHPNEIVAVSKYPDISPAFTRSYYGTYKLHSLEGKPSGPMRELWWWTPPQAEAE